MEINIKGSMNLEQSPIEKALEERLKCYGIKLKENNNEEPHFGNIGRCEPILIERSTSSHPPYIEYCYGFDEHCKTINEFAYRLNKKKHHKETIHIRFPDSSQDYKQFILFFYSGRYQSIFMDDFEEFAIPFLTTALKNSFGTEIPSKILDDEKKFIEWIEKEKRARSPPATSSSEFQAEALNRDLVYMLVDEFARRLLEK